MARKPPPIHRGFTFQPVTGVSPSTGYGVSIHREREERRHINDLTPQILHQWLAEYVQRNHELFADRRNHFGGWFEEDTGQVYLDVSIVVESEREADYLARTHGEKAYFDFARGKPVPVQ